MKSTEYSIFYPISKVDNEQRMVWGLASTPEKDTQGDIIPVEAIKNALPEYLKYPTIREMHQPIAAGKTIYTDISDEGLRIGAKIVDDNAWKKVKEGVYAGFSIGGSILERDGDVIKALDLAEISLVDSPANKGARIEVFKADVNKAVWSTAFINNLPDSSFAYIEPGGKKDKEGKTVPRSKRHFPYKDASGKVDLPHLRNALARAPQSPFGDKAMPKLRSAARANGVGEEKKVKGIDELRKDFAMADNLADVGRSLEALQDYCEDCGIDTSPIDRALTELKPLMGTLVNHEHDDEDSELSTGGTGIYMMRQDTLAKINTMLHALVGVGVHPDKVKSLVKEVTTKMKEEK